MRECPRRLQGTKPVQQVFVLVPGWDGGNRRRVGKFLQCLSFHLEVCSRVDLSCFDIDVTKEISNHVE